MSNDVDTLAQSRAAHEQFDELVQQFEAQPQADVPVEPSQADLQWLNDMQAYRDEGGKRLYESSDNFRSHLESARARVFAGGSIASVLDAARKVADIQ